MIDTLRAKGFTYISIDMARGVSATAWRGLDRKTYAVYRQPSVEAALTALLAKADEPEDEFEDLL